MYLNFGLFVKLGALKIEMALESDGVAKTGLTSLATTEIRVGLF
jgi:hypothetical protein